ncbi:serine protease 38-like [Vombatus ursinus]|uniref:serine protease 38-like n=1 Tax=Vombatus ursinus TaxID=29139 RepID=UPI000FFD56A0|nr:serine protease 38-like [Vombatus ursinus]
MNSHAPAGEIMSPLGYTRPQPQGALSRRTLGTPSQLPQKQALPGETEHQPSPGNGDLFTSEPFCCRGPGAPAPLPAAAAAGTHDIALLELKSSVASSPYILPICLPAPGLYYERKSCWITGWGTLTETGQQPAEIYLQEANIPVIDNHTCSSFYGVPIEGNVIYEIKEDMLCAGDIINQRAICVGDSGSPLVCEFSETWIQVGIASWGMACVPPVSPSVFSRVSYYLDWIEQTKKISHKLLPTKASNVRKVVEVSKTPQPTSYASASQISVQPVLLCRCRLMALWFWDAGNSL